MVRQSKSKGDPRIEALRPYLEGVAKKLADEIFGPQGPRWGTTLTELEDLALQARSIFSEKMVELSLERQAVTPKETRPHDLQACPSCQRPTDAAEEPVPRTVATRAGEVAWSEPREYCPRCRRAFFPSEQKSRH